MPQTKSEGSLSLMQDTDVCDIERGSSLIKQCSGGRPSCANCFRQRDVCEYDLEEGVTKQQSLSSQVNALQTELALVNQFVQRLRNSSDDHACGLLARLRMGEEVSCLTSDELLNTDRCVFSTKSLFTLQD